MSSKICYKNDRWKWVTKLIEDGSLPQSSKCLIEKITNLHILQAYGLDKSPKVLPCRKKCNSSPWCLVSIAKETKSEATALTKQIRDMKHPVGLQNTANTCWINSALQALFSIHEFRSRINSILDFTGEGSLNSLEYLLQAMFVEMETHQYKALACTPGSVFERLAVFVTKEIMQKDADFEVLKCVSEFLENTVDTLLANPRTGPLFTSVFRTTLYRVAKWKCSSCGKEHVRQLPPDSCYTMAAYVSGDECPLDQCILDLQTETQTGVSLDCGDEGGCGSRVAVDRVVTPQILSLPSLLIIRNNSLIDRELKRRLHVVYSETLDLSTYTCDGENATYTLRAVIYHHGHWIKHFSAHVKAEDGKWYNFNDEKVSLLETRSGNAHPSETHKDYFSLPNVANKYKKKRGIRVSRGSFVWIYQKDVETEKSSLVPAPEAVVQYVLSKRDNSESVDGAELDRIKKERANFLGRLALENSKEKYSIISSPVLSSWYGFSGLKFEPNPSLLAEGICRHEKFDPIKMNSFKLIKEEMVLDLCTKDFGIHHEGKVPVVLPSENAFCLECLSRHAHHIIFTNYLKNLQKKAKKELSKEQKIGTTFVGMTTLAQWTKLALNHYWKENGFDEEESRAEESSNDPESNIEVDDKPSTPLECDSKPLSSNGSESNALSVRENGSSDSDEEIISRFNQDIVCHHGQTDPHIAGVYIPNGTVEEMKHLCHGSELSSSLTEDLKMCPDCLSGMDKTLETCEAGKEEKKRLYQLFWERRRPHSVKDVDKTLFFVSRDFVTDWRSFVRLCSKNDSSICRPLKIENSCVLCKHGRLLYRCSMDKENPLFELALLTFEEEWNELKDLYPFDVAIQAKLDPNGCLVPEIGPCEEGCVEEESRRLYEELFVYASEGINIRQVNSENDVPRQSDALNSDDLPKKRQRTEVNKSEPIGSSSLRTASERLVRASKWFSSSDTIKEVQNFIAERTGIWPLLQTLWLKGGGEHGPDPFLLTDKHRSMTLNGLRIKAGDTIYFRATKEDLEKASGDGVTEYDEPEIDIEQ